MLKINKNDSIVSDYEGFLADILNGAHKPVSRQNLKDAIKILLRLTSNPNRTALKKTAKNKGIKDPVVHHCTKTAKTGSTKDKLKTDKKL